MSDVDKRPESSEEMDELPSLDGIVIAPYEGDVDDDEGPVGDGPIIDDDDDDEAEKSEGSDVDAPAAKEKEASPPPRRKVPGRAPPAPPPRACDIPKDTWSSKPTSNRVWEVDAEEEYDDNEQGEPEYDLSSTKLANDYDIGRKLGRGFFATAKLVTEKKTGQNFAVKVIDKSMAPQFGDKLKSELDILSKLEHTNVLQGKQLYETDSHLLVVLELAEGGEVAQVLGKTSDAPYSEADVHRIAKQLISALDHIHSKGVIHGDLAPENVLLVGDEKSTVKLGGFSGALMASGESENQQMIGNSEFQAPEIIMNQGFDKSTDLWSLGCILYFLVEGSSPFQDSNTMRMNMKIRQGKFEYGDNWKDVSASLKDLISSLIKVNASERTSASDCLSHSWVSGSPKGTPLPNARKNMTAPN
uniref:non-specific serine/threonine protein kinase n=1 Tax=Vannella robusta TaxID=1487602 RepID=A0A7S4HV92_9EUKA|mmetsp:Transcript_16050/g.20528  ORF Transcript_16050/g.20528 Transcript_16050/m.20528 type:complete len:415 (+) Transcript_16050:57-1301(+)